MKEDIKYFFTTSGGVYPGYKMDNPGFPKYHIIVPANNLEKFQNSTFENINDIEQLAWLFRKECLVNELPKSFTPSQRVDKSISWKNHEFDRGILFIFGAGASANCIVGQEDKHSLDRFLKDECRPPLGNELFNKRFKNIYDQYPSIHDVIYDLQKKSANIEEYLQEEWADIEQFGNRRLMTRHVQIQLYFRELLMRCSSKVIHDYKEHNLVRKFSNSIMRSHWRGREKQFAIITFNQDTILETLLQDAFNHKFQTIEEYVSVDTNPFVIFKPHGSWDWGWKYETNKNADNLVRTGDLNFYQLNFECLGSPETMVDWTSFGTEMSLNKHKKGKLSINRNKIVKYNIEDYNRHFPAILLPYRDKDEFTFPYKHYQYMREYLSFARHIVIIGWKGNEALFNKELLNKGTKVEKITIVDPNPEGVKANLAGFIAERRIVPILFQSFEDYIEKGLDQDLA